MLQKMTIELAQNQSPADVETAEFICMKTAFSTAQSWDKPCQKNPAIINHIANH